MLTLFRLYITFTTEFCDNHFAFVKIQNFWVRSKCYEKAKLITPFLFILHINLIFLSHLSLYVSSFIPLFFSPIFVLAFLFFVALFHSCILFISLCPPLPFILYIHRSHFLNLPFSIPSFSPSFSSIIVPSCIFTIFFSCSLVSISHHISFNPLPKDAEPIWNTCYLGLINFPSTQTVWDGIRQGIVFLNALASYINKSRKKWVIDVSSVFSSAHGPEAGSSYHQGH